MELRATQLAWVAVRHIDVTGLEDIVSVIQGKQAIVRLASILHERDNPDDDGPLAELGDAWDDVNAKLRAAVEAKGLAVKGKIVFTIDLKAMRTKGGECGLEVETSVVVKAPPKPKRGAMLYLDHDGVASTAPVQAELPIFAPKAIDGGKSDSGKATKKATV
jgi:hypothetical protein